MRPLGVLRGRLRYETLDLKTGPSTSQPGWVQNCLRGYRLLPVSKSRTLVTLRRPKIGRRPFLCGLGEGKVEDEKPPVCFDGSCNGLTRGEVQDRRVGLHLREEVLARFAVHEAISGQVSGQEVVKGCSEVLGRVGTSLCREWSTTSGTDVYGRNEESHGYRSRLGRNEHQRPKD